MYIYIYICMATTPKRCQTGSIDHFFSGNVLTSISTWG